MANIKSAAKKAVQAEKRRKKNLARRTAIKTAIKKVLVAIAEGQSDVKEFLKDVEVKLARAKSKKVMHKNAASRKLSRLATKVAKAQKAK